MPDRWTCNPPFDKARQSHYAKYRRRLRICRWCGAKLPSGRSSWCSDACSEEYMIRVSGNVLRGHVFKRDNGICAECGIDTGKLDRVAGKILRGSRRWCWQRKLLIYDKANPQRLKWLFARWPWIEARYASMMSFWEAAHIVALAEGGHNGLSNYKTLCVGCHRKDTKELAGKLAKQRRQEVTGQIEIEFTKEDGC